MVLSLDWPRSGPRPARAAGAVLALAALLATPMVATGCAAGPSKLAGGKVRVAAVEAAWGSLAQQIGGAHVQVVSIVSGPGADPHSFEPRPRDAVTLAQAQLVIVNGAGYDTWAHKLLAATTTPGRIVIDVADATGAGKGANPHFWYDPAAVTTVIGRIVAALDELDPAHAGDYDTNRNTLETTGLADYHRLLAELRTRYHGVGVGISESIFEPLARATGLQVVTPVSFANAVAEGTDPTAADRADITAAIRERRLAVFLYNRQNATPDVDAAVDECRRAGIPVVAMTETPDPAGTSFQDWQTAQLRRLLAALAGATSEAAT